jgi:hypothetical protein
MVMTVPTIVKNTDNKQELTFLRTTGLHNLNECLLHI